MLDQGKEKGEVQYRWHKAVVHIFICKQNSIFRENSDCSQDKGDEQVHMDVIPCAVEFSDVEGENRNCSSRETHSLQAQTGIQGDFRHLPKQINDLSLFERE